MSFPDNRVPSQDAEYNGYSTLLKALTTAIRYLAIVVSDHLLPCPLDLNPVQNRLIFNLVSSSKRWPPDFNPFPREACRTTSSLNVFGIRRAARGPCKMGVFKGLSSASSHTLQISINCSIHTMMCFIIARAFGWASMSSQTTKSANQQLVDDKSGGNFKKASESGLAILHICVNPKVQCGHK